MGTSIIKYFLHGKQIFSPGESEREIPPGRLLQLLSYRHARDENSILVVMSEDKNGDEIPLMQVKKSKNGGIGDTHLFIVSPAETTSLPHGQDHP